MGLGSIIADAVEAARLGVESHLVSITHRAWAGQDAEGVADLGDPVTIPNAFVQEGEVYRTTPDGKSVRAKALVQLFPTPPEAAPPLVAVRDEITLPSGYKGPISAIADGLVNAETGVPHVRTLWLG